MENNMYFKKNGKLTKDKVRGFSESIKEDMESYGLQQLRSMVKADKGSPIMVIVK